MQFVIRLSKTEEAKALPILLRHSPGVILPDRTYMLSEQAVEALRQASIRFEELGAATHAQASQEQASVKEYDIFLPLYYNDGSPVEPGKFQAVQQSLLEQFSGLTFFPQPNQGFWKMGDVLYRDEIVIYRVIAPKPRSARQFLSRLKEELKRAFRQEEILIVERDVSTI